MHVDVMGTTAWALVMHFPISIAKLFHLPFKLCIGLRGQLAQELKISPSLNRCKTAFQIPSCPLKHVKCSSQLEFNLPLQLYT